MSVTGARKLQTGLVAVLAAMTAGNAVWMLLWPAHWYASVPGPEATGPLNAHFVRDVGAAFLVSAMGFVAALIRYKPSAPFLLTASGWLVLHSGIHIWDVAAGRSTLEQLAGDLLGVHLPAVAALLALALGRRSEQGKDKPP